MTIVEPQIPRFGRRCHGGVDKRRPHEVLSNNLASCDFWDGSRSEAVEVLRSHNYIGIQVGNEQGQGPEG